MKKEELKAKLLEVSNDAAILQERCAIELQTAQFLRNEASKLLAKKEDPSLTPEEQTEILKQIEALYGKLMNESKSFQKGMMEVAKLNERFEELKKQAKNLED